MRREEVQAWAEDVARAWEARDPEWASRMFTATRDYRETPFSGNAVLEEGGVEGLWQEVLDQRDVRVTVETRVCEADAACIAYRASYTRPDGSEADTAGFWIVAFEEIGRAHV